MKTDNFLIAEGAKVKLKDHPTDFTGDYTDKDKAEKDLEKNVKRIGELQDIMYAQDVYSLLIVFQAMDAAGKDSTIEHVMTGINPQGCSVVSFKQPSIEELDHDFLWRCAKALPERGKIGIFNRSHYEEVLVVRVHPAILESQHLPENVKKDTNIWSTRFKQIRRFEDNLAESGTHILKFFLNVSRDEQKKRFLARIDEPEKNWKFSSGDVKERALWDDYMNAYADAIEGTSTGNAPWYIIPADKKWFMRLAASQIIVDKMESMNLKYPTVSDAEKLDLAEARRLLESDV
ncbi:MAG: polyphosphate kinase 2 family protein [Acidobacteriota bacterium]